MRFHGFIALDGRGLLACVGLIQSNYLIIIIKVAGLLISLCFRQEIQEFRGL